MGLPALSLDILLGFLIGLSLGLLGGGGSILTVPALVYLVGQDAHAAMTTSLAIVGANSAFGAWMYRCQGDFNLRVALLFGGSGMVAAFIASRLARDLPQTILMASFSLLMIAVGGLMLFQRPVKRAQDPPPAPRLSSILLAGGGVGLLTGFLGVGGGFLIVPALVMVLGLPITQAVSTSLLVITLNSLAGLFGRLGAGDFDLGLAAIFVSAGLGGDWLGSKLAHRIPAAALRRLFGAFVIILGFALLIPYF